MSELDSVKANSTALSLPIFEDLPKIVVAHATFQKAISGSPNEGALSYPIQTFLKVRGRGRWQDITSEQNHPILNQGGELGRPSQIDFVGRSKVTNWSFALEVKIHSGKQPDRLVRDIIKLHLLSNSDKSRNAARYFLVLFPHSPDVVNESDGKVKLLQKKYAAYNLFEQLLPWEKQQAQYRIADLSSAIRRDVDKALNGRDCRMGLKVKRIAEDWSDDFVCGLWQFLEHGKSDERYRPEVTKGAALRAERTALLSAARPFVRARS